MAELSIIQKTYDFIRWYVPTCIDHPANKNLRLGSPWSLGSMTSWKVWLLLAMALTSFKLQYR